MIPSSNIVLSNEHRTINAYLPDRQILNSSLQISSEKSSFSSWTEQDHVDSLDIMKRIVEIWKQNNISRQYLIYGKIDEKRFTWDLIPYKACSCFIIRIIQQLKVLFRIVFGGVKVTNDEKKQQIQIYRSITPQMPAVQIPFSGLGVGSDSFCKPDVINKQWVLKGRMVNVLYNYAPIGFGGERLHFLIVPNAHKESFTDISQEEYIESCLLTSRLVDHFYTTRKKIKNIYLLNKTGVDAGQSVKHWHLHVIVSTHATQDIWSKITVLKNILIGSTPLKAKALEEKILSLRAELSKLEILSKTA